MQPDDLLSVHVPADPHWHPDGSRLAYVVGEPNADEDRTDRRIWLHDGSRSRPLTAGPADLHPRWSPEGTRLAFVRIVEGKAQVAILPTDGGEAEVVTELDPGVMALDGTCLAWLDERYLVAVVREWTDGWDELDDDARTKRARRHTTLPIRRDGIGYLHHRRQRVMVIDADGEESPRPLVDDDAWGDTVPDQAAPVVAPDGQTVAFLADPSPQPGLSVGALVWTADVDSGKLTEVVGRGFWILPGYSPDGTLHVLGDTTTDYPLPARLWRIEDDGPVALTGDRSVFSVSGGAPTLSWQDDVAHVLWEDSGAIGVAAVTPDGKTTALVSGHRAVHAFDVSTDGRLAAVVSQADATPELILIEDGEETALTDFRAAAGLDLVEPVHLRVASDDDVEVDTWVFMPPGDGPVPLLLSIHGGPAGQYGWGFLDELQVYAAAGYGVVACNPRGSSGRGREFVRAVREEGWGVVDLADIRAVVRASLDRFDRLDGDRLGIMGGSYGGFLTAWVIGHEDRWRSAIVERGLLDWTSFRGTSDIGGTFPEMYIGTDEVGRLREASPLRLAGDTRTPTLVLHAEEDWRCPIEQAEQYFAALVRAGVTTELLRFPGEGHEMSRGGSPRHRIERFEAILDWHARHLD